MTIKKAGNRSMPIISRESDNVDNGPVPSWMSEFAKSLSKVSVQPYKQEDTVFDQISSIINSSKPKHSSVDDAVKDMQERSGLVAYQNKMKALAQNIKTAGCTCEDGEQEQHGDKKKVKVKIFELKPQIQSTFDNVITDTHGNLDIPAIIDRVKGIHRKDVSDDSAWDDDGLMGYVNDKCIEIKKMNPDIGDDDNLTLGKIPNFDEKDIDRSNDDALFSLTPAVVK